MLAPPVAAAVGPTGSAYARADRALGYLTYFGGRGNDSASAIAVDAEGAAYVVVSSGSQNYPTPEDGRAGPGAYVFKLGVDGTLEYSTHVDGIDSAGAIAVDSQGAVYVVGSRRSGAPTPANNTDVVVTKLSPVGRTVYSTDFGGGRSDFGQGIAVGAEGAAYVTGVTTSPDFPVHNAVQPVAGGNQARADAFVAKLNAQGAVAYSTYLRGSSYDEGTDIAVNSSGEAYVTGTTESSDFPMRHAFRPNREGKRTHLSP